MRQRRLDRKGQLSLFDALLFFLILIIASGGLYIATIKINESKEKVNFNEDTLRCSDMLNSILVQTVDNISINDSWAPNDERIKNIYYASTEELIGIYIYMKDSDRYDVSHLPGVIKDSFNMGLLTSRYGANVTFYDINNSANSYSFHCRNSNRNPDQLPEIFVKNRVIYYLDVKIHLQFTCWHVN